MQICHYILEVPSNENLSSKEPEKGYLSLKVSGTEVLAPKVPDDGDLPLIVPEVTENRGLPSTSYLRRILGGNIGKTVEQQQQQQQKTTGNIKPVL